MTKIFFHTPEEEEIMLQKLKSEIIRVGLESNASREKLTALYDRNNMPHPKTYVENYGTWASILNKIGLENKGRVAAIKPETGPRIYWEDLPEEVRLENLIVELCRVGLNANPSINELMKVYDNNNIISPTTYKEHLGSWRNVLKKIMYDDRITLKYKLERKPKQLIDPELGFYKSMFPNGPTQDVLITAMIAEMQAKKLFTRPLYNANYNKEWLPSLYTFTRATGLTWTELKAIYTEKTGDIID